MENATRANRLVAVAAATVAGVTIAALGCKAVRAVDGPIGSWLEGNLGVLSTLRADGREHLALAALVAPAIAAGGVATAEGAALALLALSPAFRAAAGLVGKASAGEEFLLTSGEHETLATVAAGEGLVVVHADSLGQRSWHKSVSTKGRKEQ